MRQREARRRCVLCKQTALRANWLNTPFGICCTTCRDRWTAARDIEGHRWVPTLPARHKPRKCEAGHGMVLQMGQPRFQQCGAPATHTRPWLTPYSRWPMALCATDAALAEKEGALVLVGEWWPEQTVVEPKE